MNDEVKQAAQAEAEKTYKGFLSFLKYLSYAFVAIILVASFNNWGVETGPGATGSKSDPELYEEYLDRMKEMKEEYKK